MSNQEQNISSRLESFGIDDSVIGPVLEVHGKLGLLGYQELIARHPIEEVTVPATREQSAFQLLVYTPQSDHDEHYARVVHAPIFLGPDANARVRTIWLATAEPNTKLFFTASPTTITSPYNKLNHEGRIRVARGNTEPLVTPLLRYLEREKITTVEQIGYSFGGLTAATGSRLSPEYGITTVEGIFAEPAAVAMYGLLKLARNFNGTAKPFDEYVQATQSKALHEAKDVSRRNKIHYLLGFFGLTNMAIARCLAQPIFEDQVIGALQKNKDMYAAIAHGTKSELSTTEEMQAVLKRIEGIADVGARVVGITMNGMYHSGGEDLNLHLALLLQAHNEVDQRRVNNHAHTQIQ